MALNSMAKHVLVQICQSKTVRLSVNVHASLRKVNLIPAPPGWLSGERVGLMTWWLGVRFPDEANFLSGVFSPLTSAEACEKSSRWLWKEKLC